MTLDPSVVVAGTLIGWHVLASCEGQFAPRITMPNSCGTKGGMPRKGLAAIGSTKTTPGPLLALTSSRRLS